MTSTFPFSERIEQALSRDILSLGLHAATLGIVSHLTFFRVLAVEEYLLGLLALYLTIVVAIVYACFSLTDISPFQVMIRVLWISTCYNVSLMSSVGIYRLFFHRLHRFPGPVLSKLSRFYDTYLAGRNVQYNKEIEKLHETYGDFIRTGPREICIVRKSAVSLVHGPQSKCLKSTFYAQTSTDPKCCSVHQSRDRDDHRRRRRAWDRGFSVNALATYEPRIKTHVGQLTSHIESNLGKPVNMTKWSMFLSFDIMGSVGFSKGFRNLTSGIEHPAIKGVHDHMAILGVMSHIPWLLYLFGYIPGVSAGFIGFFTWCGDEVERKKKEFCVNEYPQDIVSWLLKAYIEKDGSAPPSDTALHEDSRTLIVAGSETTATILASALYYLAKNPAVLEKVQRQLDKAMPAGPNDWSYEKVKEVTYLDDIINETLRLRPAVMTGGPRVTPPEGIQVDEVYIPGDVNVLVPTQLLQTDERYYKDARNFVPERWNENKEMCSSEAPFLPFILGPFACPGKNLALMSLRISISILALTYNIKFAAGETGEIFENETQDTFTTALPPLQIQFTPR